MQIHGAIDFSRKVEAVSGVAGTLSVALWDGFGGGKSNTTEGGNCGKHNRTCVCALRSLRAVDESSNTVLIECTSIHTRTFCGITPTRATYTTSGAMGSVIRTSTNSSVPQSCFTLSSAVTFA